MDPSLSTGGTSSQRSAAPAQGEVQKSCQRIECSCRRFVSESNAGDAECGPRRGSCAWRRGDAYVEPARAFRPQAMRARRQRHTCCSRLIRSTAAHQPGGGPFERRSGGADDGAKDAHLLSRLGRRPPIRLRTLPGTRRAPRGARGHWVLDRHLVFGGVKAGGGSGKLLMLIQSLMRCGVQQRRARRWRRARRSARRGGRSRTVSVALSTASTPTTPPDAPPRPSAPLSKPMAHCSRSCRGRGPCAPRVSSSSARA